MKKFLSLVLALVMAMSLVTISAGAKDFEDNSDINYADAVAVMSELKVVDGYTDGTFRPETQLNRGAAAKIVCNMILGPTTASALSASSAPFSDVPADHVFAGYITYCAKEGIINGYSDGTFRPTAPLTGYAFMKMLLGALGYDPAVEGYTGANWSVNVAKQAIGIGLDDGNKEFVGTKYVTREEACLYAFNTLQAYMVEYNGKASVSVNGAELVVGGELEKTTTKFYQEYFKNLKGIKSEDDFGRPATAWSVKSKKIGTFAKDYELLYTKSVKAGEIYEDLGELDINVAYHYEDGKYNKVDVTDMIVEDNEDDKFGGNGTIVEVYAEEVVVAGEYVWNIDIVEINTYISKIAGEDENKDDERVVLLEDETVTYKTEEFVEDDYVLYTKAQTKADELKIKSMELAEKIEDVKVEKLNLSKSKFEAAGETYELGAKHADAMPAYDSTYDLYVDEYGYVMLSKLVEDEINYAVMFGVRGADWALLDPNDEFTARLVMLDGTKQDVTAVLATGADFDLGDLIAYTYDEEEDIYELDNIDPKEYDELDGTAVFTKGKSAIIDGSKKIYTNSKTIFLMAEVDEDGKWSFESVTGFKNAPSMENMTAQLVVDGVAEVVYVTDSKAAASSDDLTFIIGKSGVKYEKKDTFYEYNAIINGEIDTIMIEATEEGVIADYTAMVTVLTEVTENSRGVVTEAEFDAAILEDIEIAMGVVTKKYDDETEILTIKRDGESKAVGFGVADDAAFFSVDKDGNITESKAASMKKGETVIFVVNEDGVIDLCMMMNEKLLG